MMNSGYNEPPDQISDSARDMHQALASLQEELAAIDFYQQRIDLCEEEELQAILIHNMETKTECVTMLLEWLRRNYELFDKDFKAILFGEDPIAGE